MCTVSLISLRDKDGSPSGFRAVCNRDERRTRPAAASPRWRAVEGSPARALWPMDMEAGGTWIGVSDRGLLLSILNLNPDPPIDVTGLRGLRSRGLIIPDLLAEPNADRAVRRLARMDLDQFAPFRLLAISGVEPRSAELRWDRSELTVAWHDGPICLASSGLGDSRVLRRLDLFDELVLQPGATPERQDDYHRHAWPEHPELSVLMSRPDARTVSITTIEVPGGAEPAMIYEPVAAAAALAPR